MSVEITLETVAQQTCFAPLAVVGYCITQSDLLQPLWAELDVAMKCYRHTVPQKLQDVLVAILAGCRSLAQVNSRLRPERALAQAWQRAHFAEQSTLSRTLDALCVEQIEQLRAGHLALLQRHSQLRHHDWRQPVILDIDPTTLLASKRAEGSRKGWVSGQRNQYGRHVIRCMVAGYHETLLSVTSPGNRHGYEYCKPTLEHLLQHWPWSRRQRQQTIIRSDAGLGTEQNLRHILWQGFQVLMKGFSGRRTQAWVQRTPATRWQPDPAGAQRWVAPAPEQPRLGRRITASLLRWRDATQQTKHATLWRTLPYPTFTQWALYDGRAAAEVEIRADKSGLNLPA
jgi:hypothetical protein